MKAQLLKRISSGALRLLYPPACVGCGALAESAGLPLCPVCTGSLERADTAELRRFLAREGSEPGAFALWRFDRGGAFQAVHHALKYGGRARYGVALGRLVGEAFAPHLRGTLVPIPLHRRRFLERGYNQSALIARGVGERTGQPVAEAWLRRPAYNETQTRLGRTGRAANVRTAFVVPEEAPVAGADLVLVDDILTTGATLLAAAEVLRAAGAASVQLAAVAWAR